MFCNFIQPYFNKRLGKAILEMTFSYWNVNYFVFRQDPTTPTRWRGGCRATTRSRACSRRSESREWKPGNTMYPSVSIQMKRFLSWRLPVEITDLLSKNFYRWHLKKIIFVILVEKINTSFEFKLMFVLFKNTKKLIINKFLNYNFISLVTRLLVVSITIYSHWNKHFIHCVFQN